MAKTIVCSLGTLFTGKTATEEGKALYKEFVEGQQDKDAALKTLESYVGSWQSAAGKEASVLPTVGQMMNFREMLESLNNNSTKVKLALYEGDSVKLTSTEEVLDDMVKVTGLSKDKVMNNFEIVLRTYMNIKQEYRYLLNNDRLFNDIQEKLLGNSKAKTSLEVAYEKRAENIEVNNRLAQVPERQIMYKSFAGDINCVKLLSLIGADNFSGYMQNGIALHQADINAAIDALASETGVSRGDLYQSEYEALIDKLIEMTEFALNDNITEDDLGWNVLEPSVTIADATYENIIKETDVQRSPTTAFVFEESMDADVALQEILRGEEPTYPVTLNTKSGAAAIRMHTDTGRKYPNTFGLVTQKRQQMTVYSQEKKQNIMTWLGGDDNIDKRRLEEKDLKAFTESLDRTITALRESGYKNIVFPSVFGKHTPMPLNIAEALAETLSSSLNIHYEVRKVSSTADLYFLDSKPDVVKDLVEHIEGKTAKDRSKALGEAYTRARQSFKNAEDMSQYVTDRSRYYLRTNQDMRDGYQSMICEWVNDIVSFSRKQQYSIMSKKYLKAKAEGDIKNETALKNKMDSFDNTAALQTLSPEKVIKAVRARLERMLAMSNDDFMRAHGYYRMFRFYEGEQTGIGYNPDNADMRDWAETLDGYYKYAESTANRLREHYTLILENLDPIIVASANELKTSYDLALRVKKDMSDNDSDYTKDDTNDPTELVNDSNTDLSELEDAEYDYVKEVIESSEYDPEMSYSWKQTTESIWGSLTADIKMCISDVVEKTFDDDIAETVMGYHKRIKPENVIGPLQLMLRDCTSSDNMIQKLRDSAGLYKWAENLADAIEEDESGVLKTRFFNRFRKDAVEFFIAVSDPIKKSIDIVKTAEMNGIDAAVKDIQHNQAMGVHVVDNSLLSASGAVRNGQNGTENILQGIKDVLSKAGKDYKKIADTLKTEQAALPEKEKLNKKEYVEELRVRRKDFLEENEVMLNSLYSILLQLDVSLSLDSFKNTILQGVKGDSTDTLSNLFFTRSKGVTGLVAYADSIAYQKGENVKTLATPYTGGEAHYKYISKVLNLQSHQNYETSYSFKGRTHYNHIDPSYLSNMMRELKSIVTSDDISASDTAAEEYLSKNFKQDMFFYDNVTGKYRLKVLEQLREYEDGRENLEDCFRHTLFLHRDGKELDNWDEASYMATLIDTFHTDYAGDGASFYAIPVPADAPQVEMVSLPRLQIASEAMENVESKLLDLETVQDMNSQLSSIVMQELIRILRIRKRKGDILAGKIKPMKNYDLCNANGKPFKSHGAEFKFFPQLNRITDGTGKTVLDNMIEMYEGRREAELLKYIENVLIDNNIISREYNNFIEYLEETSFNQYSLHSTREALKEVKGTEEDLIKAVDQIKIPESPDLQEALRKIVTDCLHSMKNTYDSFTSKYNTIENARYTKQVIAIIEKAFEDTRKIRNDAFEKRFAASGLAYTEENRKAFYKKDKFVPLSMPYALKSILDNAEHNAEKSARMYDFFCNNLIARNTIIQLTTSDLAFYPNAADFYKRYKEVHANGMPLDTTAVFNYTQKDGTSVTRKAPTHEKSIVIADEEVASDIKSFVRNAMKYATETDILPELAADNVNHAFDNLVNVTDGQSLRSFKSYTDITLMTGSWNEVYQEAYDRIMSGGKWTESDFYTIWEVIKPYFFSNLMVQDGNRGSIRMPHQNKNSECPLLAMYKMFKGFPVAKSAKVVALDEFLNENGIDVAHFNSVVKVGEQGTVSLTNNAVAEKRDAILKSRKEQDPDFDTESEKNRFKAEKEAVKSILSEQVLTTDSQGATVLNPEVIKTLPYNNYVKQIKTPPHHIDTDIVRGTQFNKLITADLPEVWHDKDGNKHYHAYGSTQVMKQIAEYEDSQVIADVYEEDGTPTTAAMVKQRGGFTARQIKSLYNSVRMANISHMLKDLRNIYRDPKRLEAILQDTLMKSPRFSPDMQELFALDHETGEFKHPFLNPAVFNTVESILTTISKKAIITRKIKGAALIQVSDFGYTDKLSIIFNDNRGREWSFSSWYESRKGDFRTEDDAREAYNREMEKALGDGAISIAAYECYMPVTSERLLKPLMDKDGNLDITKMPEEMREALGYRIPTEAKYSMIPLRVKGFTNIFNGSVIMMPAEITTITGSNFEIDKLYTMLYEFTVHQEYDMKQARKDFFKAYPDLKESAQDALSANLEEYLSQHKLEPTKENVQEYMNSHRLIKADSEVYNKFIDWFNSEEGNKDKYLKRAEIKKIKYDFTKPAMRNSSKARDNACIDIPYSILTSAACTPQVLTPGNSNTVAQAAALIDLIETVEYNDLKEALAAEHPDRNIESTKDMVEVLLEYKTGKLKKLTEIAATPDFILSPVSQGKANFRIQQGKSLVGVYANHSVNHAVLQSCGLNLDRPFTINGIEVSAIDRMMLKDIIGNVGVKYSAEQADKYISALIAEFAVASVDNAKNPLLGYLNQSFFTANATMVLARAGFDATTIALFMNQPIVKMMSRFSKSMGYASPEEVADTCLDVFMENLHTRKLLDSSYKLPSFKSLQNYNKFMREDLLAQIIDRKFDSRDNAVYQLQVGVMFQELCRHGEGFKSFCQYTKSDTGKGSGVGPTFGAALARIDDLSEISENKSISGRVGNWYELSERELDAIADSPIGIQELVSPDEPMAYNKSMFLASVGAYPALMHNHVPVFNSIFRSVNAMVKESSKKGKLTETLAENIIYDITSYKLTSLPFFQELTTLKGEKIKGISKCREYMIQKFPAELAEFKKKYPKFKEYSFIKRLSGNIKHKNVPVPILGLTNRRRLTDIEMQTYTAQWDAMLHHSDPIVVNFAENLIRYGFFKNGMKYGRDTFANLAPVNYMASIPGYYDTIRELYDDKNPELLKEMMQCSEQIELNYIELPVMSSSVNMKPKFMKDAFYYFTDYKGEGGVTLKAKHYNKEVSIPLKDVMLGLENLRLNYRFESDGTPVWCKYLKVDRGNAYYKLDRWDIANERLVYTKVQPLGLGTEFSEFEYHKDPDTISRK